MNKICFFLPGISRKPIGGYKVIYEYANRLAEKNWNVSIYYPCLCSLKNISLKYMVKCILKYPVIKIFKIYKPKWFYLKSEIEQVYTWKPVKKKFKKYSHIISTYIDTAYILDSYDFYDTHKIFYFIQGYEVWNNHTEADVYKSYKFPMKKFVISSWLYDKVASVGETACILQNGFDFNYFRLYKPIECRQKTQIAMLYHQDKNKRCCDAFDALDIVKLKFPDLKVFIFGAPKKPDNLPDWYTYYQTPNKDTHNLILNEASIFVAASENEGFGLTVGEAMICGCAIACTNNMGFTAMVKHDYSGLISSVYDINELADNIIELINNDSLRYRLANEGNREIKRFTWDKSFEKLEKELSD